MANTELLTEIEETPITNFELEATEKFMNKFSYTAQMLTAVSIWLDNNGDSIGAAKMLEFAGEFARHEAETV